MKNIQAKIEYATPFQILGVAARTCTDTREKAPDEMDLPLVHSLVDKGHHSVLEHAVFTFDLSGFSRAVLQELARHRIASYSVQSTRYTLNRLKYEEPFTTSGDMARAERYLVFNDTHTTVDVAAMFSLERTRALIGQGYKPDEVKTTLPEGFRTKAVMTINLRSLMNLLELRTSPRALKEFRVLAYKMYLALPAEYQHLCDSTVSDQIPEEVIHLVR